MSNEAAVVLAGDEDEESTVAAGAREAMLDEEGSTAGSEAVQNEPETVDGEGTDDNDDSSDGNDDDDSSDDDDDDDRDINDGNNESQNADQGVAVPTILPKYYESDGVDYLSCQSDTVIESIVTFLKFRELRQFVFISKSFVQSLSYEAVLRCHRDKEGVKELLFMTQCLPYSAMFIPSPVRLMRILSRHRCENCLGELANKQKWPGLFLCSTCQQMFGRAIPYDIFVAKGWGCPSMCVADNDSTHLLANIHSSQVLGRPEFVGPVITVAGLTLLNHEQPQLVATLLENPELLLEPLAWRNIVDTIQKSVANPPSHYECDVFFPVDAPLCLLQSVPVGRTR